MPSSQFCAIKYAMEDVQVKMVWFLKRKYK